MPCRTSPPPSRTKVRLKQLRGNLLYLDLTFGQPTAEIGDQTDLQLPRVPSIALDTHLGCVALDVRTQGTVLLAQSVIFKNLLHQCSPSRPACQENTARTMPGKYSQNCRPRPENQLARNSPEPGIVPNRVGTYAFTRYRRHRGQDPLNMSLDHRVNPEPRDRIATPLEEHMISCPATTCQR